MHRLDAVGDDVASMSLRFYTRTQLYDIRLRRISLWGSGARLIINEGNTTREPALPTLPTFKGHMVNTTGTEGVSAVVMPDGAVRLHIFEAGMDLVLRPAREFDLRSTTLTEGDSILYASEAPPQHHLGDDAALHHNPVGKPTKGLHAPPRVASPGVRKRHRSLSTLGTLPSGPPYGRMWSCPASGYYTSKIGVVVDWGFSSAVGGTEAAVLAELASLISQTNVIFVDQVGVEFALGAVVINLDNSGSPAATGPNYGPSSAGTRNSCGAAVSDPYTSTKASDGDNNGAQVDIRVRGGPTKMLHLLSKWVGDSAPVCAGCSHWHLLTHCFPAITSAATTIGLAFTSASCEALSSSRAVVFDSGGACGGTCDIEIVSSGNAASVGYTSSTTCPADEGVCYAPVALTSYDGAETWRTFAHEVGHTFGANHTFGLGGLMDYNDDEQFYDNGLVCEHTNAKLAESAQTCLVSGSAVCGDGVRSEGGAEQCDDGNTSPGDGCDGSCQLECGYSCTEDAQRRTTCSQACGNSLVEPLFYEECDDSTACCVSSTCKLAAGALCSGGECCTSSCAFEPSTTPCGTGGFCGAGGECVVPSVCARFGFAPCAKEVASACEEHCLYNGACTRMSTLTNGDGSPIEGRFLDAGRPCASVGGVAGVCDGAGGCVTASTCGNGVVDAGEECDDNSRCCDQSTCQLSSGAVCSGGECCTAECAFELASVACGSGSGYCRRGACETTMPMCDFIWGGANVAIDTSTCPIGGSSPGNLEVACAMVCKRTAEGTCLAGSATGSIDYYLPAGTPCNAQTGSTSPARQGVCVDAPGGTSRTCAAVDVCVVPSVAAGPASPPSPPPPSPSPPPPNPSPPPPSPSPPPPAPSPPPPSLPPPSPPPEPPAPPPPLHPPPLPSYPPFSPLEAGVTVVSVPATVITVSLTVSGDVSSFDESAQASLQSAMQSYFDCYNPCVLQLRIASASTLIDAVITVPDAAPSSIASAVTAAATTLVTQPAGAISSALGNTINVVSAAPVAVQTGVVVPLAVAPPPPALPPSPPPPQSPASEGGMVIIIAAGGGAALIAVVVGIYCVLNRRSKGKGPTLARV